MCIPNGHFSESMEEKVDEMKEIIIDHVIVYMSCKNVTPNIATSQYLMSKVFFYKFFSIFMKDKFYQCFVPEPLFRIIVSILLFILTQWYCQ